MEPVRCMGYHADLRDGQRNHQSSREVKERMPSATQGLIQRDKLKPEKLISQSSAQLHHEIKRGIGDRSLLPPKSTLSLRKYSAERKVIKDEELVKNMSNLPSYLQQKEKGRTLQKKVLNYGVLDWQHLERSKYNERHPCRSSKYPQSNSYTSSSFSTVGSSTLSSGSDLVHLGHPRKQPPVWSPHLSSSSRDIYARRLKPSRDAPQPQKLRGAHGTNSSLPKLEKGSGRTSESMLIRERQTSLSSDDGEVMSCPNGKMRSPENEFTQTKKFHEFTLPDQRCPGRQKTIVLLLPTSSTRTSCSGASPKSESTMLSYETSTEANHRSFSGSNCSSAIQSAELSSVMRHSGPMVCSVESNKQTNINLVSRRVAPHSTKAKSDVSHLAVSVERPTVQSKDKRLEKTESTAEPMKVLAYKHSNGLGMKATDAAAMKGRSPSPCHRSSVSVVAQGTKVSSDAFQSPLLAEMPTLQSKGQRSEETRSTREPMKIIVLEPSDGSGLKALDSSATKTRSPSPDRRVGVGSGRMGRSFSFKESSPLPQASSACVTAKTPMRSDSSLDNLNRDKLNANSRARSSPLRRLLDPILRPKSASASRRCSIDLSHQESPSTSICEPSHGWLDSSDGHLVKRTLDFSNCNPTNTNGSHMDEKHLTQMVQALLQVTVRNGLPWFTFAVDNNSDVLAATMKKTSICGKYDCSWIYTFYSFHKVTKKSGGWIGQGSKAKSREYVPNNVGQMKVSGSQCPTLTRHHSKDQIMVREFVLLGVEPRPADEEWLHTQPDNELAAIIVKVPKETDEKLLCDELRRNKHTRLPKCLPGEKCYCNLVGSPQSGISGSQNVFGTVVLLPNGVHGISASGAPSPLIERWKSGGSCDCGGWDVGCGIRVLSDHKQQTDKLCPSKSLSATDQCDLLVQGGRDHVSLTTYKKGIYSIDFNASISSLQAFSVCIAFLHSRNLAELSEMDSKLEEVTLTSSLSVETVSRMKLIA